MSHFASLISKFDPNNSHLIALSPNSNHSGGGGGQQHTTTTTLHLYRSNHQQAMTSSCTTTSGINTNTNSSALSYSTNATPTSHTNSNLIVTPTSEPASINLLANSSASKFYNFNHTLTDSSTTGGTGTSTKSTHLFSLPPNSQQHHHHHHHTQLIQSPNLNDKEAILGVCGDNSSDSVKLSNNKNR